jgi:NAD-dependent deacetylase
VILFGETLPKDELVQAQAKSRSADVFLAIGSSLTVQPAASLPRYAIDNGGTLLIVNLDRTDLSSQATHDFRADVTEVLPALTDAVLEG